MKRTTPLRPGKPPRRTAAPKRSKELPKRNEKRARARHAEAYGGDYKAWICGMPCLVCEKHGWVQVTPTVPAHCAKTRGAGGKAEHMAPLCADHERIWHFIGRITFARRYRVRLRAAARRLWETYWGEES